MSHRGAPRYGTRDQVQAYVRKFCGCEQNAARQSARICVEAALCMAMPKPHGRSSSIIYIGYLLNSLARTPITIDLKTVMENASAHFHMKASSCHTNESIVGIPTVGIIYSYVGACRARHGATLSLACSLHACRAARRFAPWPNMAFATTIARASHHHKRECTVRLGAFRIPVSRLSASTADLQMVAMVASRHHLQAHRPFQDYRRSLASTRKASLNQPTTSPTALTSLRMRCTLQAVQTTTHGFAFVELLGLEWSRRAA